MRDDPPSRPASAPVLFLYGSLRSGQESHAALGLSSRSRHMGSDRVTGRLLDIGDWPALIPGPGAPVVGELRLVVDPALIADLDAFERAVPGCPGGQIFERRTIRTLGGYDANVYAWLGNGLAAPVVRHGDWVRHLQETRK